MMRRIRASLFPLMAVAICGILFDHASVGASEYRYAPGHFSFTLPDGWQEMDPDRLAAVNAETAKVAPGQAHFVAGFIRESEPNSWPYVLLQVTNGDTSGLSYDSFERGFKKGMRDGVKKSENAVKDFMTNMQMGETSFDRQRNRYLLLMQSDLADGSGKLNSLMLGHLGAKGVVNLHCYALDANYADSLPIFQSMNDSFTFDKGFDFVPRAKFGLDFQAIAYAAGVGIGIVIVVIVAVAISQKKKRCGDSLE